VLTYLTSAHLRKSSEPISVSNQGLTAMPQRERDHETECQGRLAWPPKGEGQGMVFLTLSPAEKKVSTCAQKISTEI
jgi:hypothetical protein